MAKGDFTLKVGGVAMPCPSAYEWSLQDVSAGESGRTDDAKMQKNRIAQKRKIQLSWSNPTASEASTILKAFNPEYINVNYWDAMDGKQETRTFYVGDRTAPVKNWWVGNKRFETVSFDIIER